MSNRVRCVMQDLPVVLIANPGLNNASHLPEQ